MIPGNAAWGFREVSLEEQLTVIKNIITLFLLLFIVSLPVCNANTNKVDVKKRPIVSKDINSETKIIESNKSPVEIRKGAFYSNGKYVYFTGAFTHFSLKSIRDRRGAWSQNHIYNTPLNKSILREFGFNTYHPQNFTSNFIIKKYYPELLKIKRTTPNGSNYSLEAESLASEVLARMDGTRIITGFSDIGTYLGFGKLAKRVLKEECFQKNDNWDQFFPLDPSNKHSFELYNTIFHEATKFILEHGGNPFIYELVNEPFYNSYSNENLNKFKKWLSKKYLSIKQINKTWNSKFASISDIVKQLPIIKYKQKGMWYDWMYFQSEMIADYLNKFANTIKSVDKRGVPIYFTWQEIVISSMKYNNAFSQFFANMDIICTEYGGRNFGITKNIKFDGKNFLEAGGLTGKDSKYLYGALAKAYSKGTKPVIDNEMSIIRKMGDIRIPCKEGDIATALWAEVMAGHSASVFYSWSGRNWEWKNYKEAKKSALSTPYKEAQLLNPYNFPFKTLNDLKVFRQNIDRLSDIVLPRPRVIGKVGVLYLDHQAWMLKERAHSQYITWQKSLQRLQMPNDFIIAENLSTYKDLSRFKVVFCPVIEYCPQKIRSILKKYVKNGGILVCAANSFIYNEYGVSDNSEIITGLKFKKLSRVFYDFLGFNLQNTLKTKVAVLVSAKTTSAKKIVVLKTSKKATVLKNKIGNGAVYSLTFEAGNYEKVFDFILNEQGVFRDFEVTKKDGSIDGNVMLDVINRADTQFFHLLNNNFITELRYLKGNKFPQGNSYLYDAVSWKEISSPSGKRYWIQKELENGVPVVLPPEKRVLLLLGKSPSKWKSGSVNVGNIGKNIHSLQVADKVYLKTVSVEKFKLEREEKRNFKNVNPEKSFFIDLSKVVNMGFKDETAGDNKGGWTDQGSSNDFHSFPAGRQYFYGVPYQIIDPDLNNGKAIVVLKNKHVGNFPKEVKGISVNKKAEFLFFLQASAWPHKKVSFSYKLNYEDGKAIFIPITSGKSTGEWWNPRLAKKDLRIAFTTEVKGKTKGVYTYRWQNPQPDKLIKTIDIISEEENVPIIIAITGVEKTDTNKFSTSDDYPVLTGSTLNPNYAIYVFRSGKLKLGNDDNNYLTVSDTVAPGTWGGIVIQNKKNHSPIKLNNKFDWQLAFDVNYPESQNLLNSRFAKIQVHFYYADTKKKSKSIKINIDANPKTWQRKYIPVKGNKLNIFKVVFQYVDKNSTVGMQIKHIFFVSTKK